MGNDIFVSVVIPARNASKYILACLQSIDMLDYPRRLLEVIVADNGSTDETARIAREWGARVVNASGLRVGGVRNRGAAYAKGSIIAFTDSDILVGRRWIATAVECLQDERIGAVGGGCRSPKNGTWVEKAWTTRPIAAGIRVKHLAGSCFVLKRSIFEKLGGFNEDLIAAEDDDLSERTRNLGLCLYNLPNCEVIHLGYPQSLIDVARRQVWHGSSIVLKDSQICDPMTLLTYFFLIASTSLIPATMLALKHNTFLIVNALFLITIPFVVALRKALKGNEYYPKLLHFAQLWIIFFCYFSGKCIGILSRILKRDRRDSYFYSPGK